MSETFPRNPEYSGESDRVTEEEEEEEPFLEEKHLYLKGKKRPVGRYIAAILILVCLVIAGFGTAIFESYSTRDLTPSSSSCESLGWRREWRTLSNHEKEEYISAVQLLMKLPSKIGFDNESIYDDFQFIHAMTLDQAHRPGMFAAWHRWFIKLFENALRNECGYTGYLPYWNWSYDWHNLTASPLFDNEYGFGGDGNRSDVKSWRGYCVTTGPFAHHQVPYEYTEVVPHCLSRHFADEETLATLNSGVTPESVEELLSADTFAHFSNMLESQHIHLTIVKFILGDFASRGAAGDPLWYIHHSQIDRLWWLWQQRNPKSQFQDFDPFSDFSHETTPGLHDVTREEYIDIGSLGRVLGPAVRIKDMYDTRSKDLCYGYQ